MTRLDFSSIRIAITLLVFIFTHTKSFTEASTHTNDTIKRCIAHERSALLTFRAGLSDPANRLSSWEGDNCCEWQGVQCSNTTSHVVKLDLSGSSLVGRILPQLGNLSNLRYLNLDSSSGGTHSTDITWLSRLSSLEHLDMSWVNLSTSRTGFLW
jgi:hypothetical protein